MTPDQLAKNGSEHGHQVALFAWCNMAAKYGWLQANDDESYTLAGYAHRMYYERGGPLIPELELLFAIHNQGHGDKIRGSIAKAEGVKAGVPDMFLPVAMFNYHGLFIELKTLTGKVSAEQSNWSRNLLDQGYQVVFAFGWQHARDLILKYLGH